MTSLILFSDFFSFELYLIVFAFYTVFGARPGYGSIFRNSIAISFRFISFPPPFHSLPALPLPCTPYYHRNSNYFTNLRLPSFA
jgi:hypothetical protein